MNTTQQPLVFIHGSGDSARVWDDVIALLGEFETLALDLPGHGALVDAPLASVDVAQYADWLRLELERRGIESPTLIGHSLGGAVVMQLALAAPSSVGRLGLVGTGARLRVAPEFLQIAQSAGEVGTSHTPEITRVGFTDAHIALADAYDARRDRTAQGMLFHDLTACNQFDVIADLERISQPTLIIVGAEDRMTPSKFSIFLQSHIAGSALAVIPGAGHYVQIEDPQRVADALRVWLA